MQGEKQRRHRSRGAFTVVEMVVVISVIGVLSAIAIPRFIDIRNEAYAAQRDGIVGAARTGIMLVAARNQVSTSPASETFPPNLEATWDGNTGGTQPSSFPSTCSASAPCFELVLTTSVTDGAWQQASATTYTYTPPVGTAKTYAYDSTRGTFQ